MDHTSLQELRRGYQQAPSTIHSSRSCPVSVTVTSSWQRNASCGIWLRVERVSRNPLRDPPLQKDTAHLLSLWQFLVEGGSISGRRRFSHTTSALQMYHDLVVNYASSVLLNMIAPEKGTAQNELNSKVMWLCVPKSYNSLKVTLAQRSHAQECSDRVMRRCAEPISS